MSGITDWQFAMICPHSLQFMTNPYITPYGNSYEKSAIEDWLISQKQTTDPLVNKPLTKQQLIKNINLENSITLFKAEFKDQPEGDLKENLNQIKKLFAAIFQKLNEIEAATEKDKQAKITRQKRIHSRIILITLGYYLFLLINIAEDYQNTPQWNPDDGPAEDTADRSSWLIGKEILRKHILHAFAIGTAIFGSTHRSSALPFPFDSYRIKAIDFAVKHRRIDLIRSLYQTIHEKHFYYYVWLAIMEYDIAALKTLDHANQAILKLSHDFLYMAVTVENLEIIEFFLKRGFSANSLPSTPFVGHRFPIHIAADKGDIDTIQLLLRYNANVNQPNSEGQTPLETALRSNKPEAVDLLIKTDPEAANQFLKKNPGVFYFDIVNRVVDTKLNFFSWLLTSDSTHLSSYKNEWLLEAIGERQPKIIELLLHHGLNEQTIIQGLSHAIHHSIYDPPALFESTNQIFKLLLKLALQTPEIMAKFDFIHLRIRLAQTFPDYRTVVSTNNISLEESTFEKQLIITASLLINAGIDITSLFFDTGLTETILLKMIDELEKTTVNLEEPNHQARGLKLLFDHALKKGYTTVVERLAEKVKRKQLIQTAPDLQVREPQPKTPLNSSRTTCTLEENTNPQMQTSAAGPKYDATHPNLIKQGLNFIPLAYTAASAGGRWLLSHLSNTPAKPRISVRSLPIDEQASPDPIQQSTIPQPTMSPTTPPSKRNFALTKTPEPTSFIEVLAVLDFIIRWKNIRPMKLASGLYSFFTSRSLSLDDDYQLTRVFPGKMRQIMDTVYKLEPSSEMLLSVNDNGLKTAKKLLTDISKSIHQALKTEKVTPSTLEDIENKFVTIDKALARCAKTIKTVKKATRLSKNGKSHELYWENGSLFARRINKKSEKHQTGVYQLTFRHPAGVSSIVFDNNNALPRDACGMTAR